MKLDSSICCIIQLINLEDGNIIVGDSDDDHITVKIIYLSINKTKFRRDKKIQV